MDWPPGSHASTFGGNPVSCAAALETIALLEEGLIEHTAELGEFLLSRLKEIKERHSLIGDVRGKGLMIGIELVCDRKAKTPAIDEAEELVQACFRRGLLLLGCGESGVRFCPPLVIDRHDAETALEIFEEALSEIENGSAVTPATSRQEQAKLSIWNADTDA